MAKTDRRWWTLAAVSVGLFMVMLDNTAVNVALPTISRKLAMGMSSLEWIVNGYTLSFAMLMLTGGKLADYFGRRRFFVIGLVLFSLASLVCGLSSSGGFLIRDSGRSGRRRGAPGTRDAVDHLGNVSG